MEINKLIAQVKNCTICENYLQPNPIVSISKHSKILIIGQAPGQTVHKTGIPWNDKSGDNLRAWLGVDKTIFYDNKIFGLMPMGFCYPGTGKNGDLPPRTECAPYWHSQFLARIKSIQLTLLIGQYAQNYYLKNNTKETLTETVKNYKSYLPQYIVLPHPSPRNNIWMAKNEWFEKDVLPILKNKISFIIQSATL